MRIVRHCIILFVLLFAESLSAQDIRKIQLHTLEDSIRTYNESRSIEKIYTQLDKPHYLNTDTIWFKAYVFDAAKQKNADKSGLLYVEIANDSNKMVHRMMLPVDVGLSWGEIALNANNYPDGTYTFRAYTNWMRNFKEDYIFSKSFSISAPTRESWLINSKMNISSLEGKDELGLALQFRDMEQTAVGLRPMKLRIMDGKRVLYRTEKETSLYGDLELQFNLPEKVEAGALSITAEDLRKGQGKRTIAIPLPVNRFKNTDLQFMPEGGYLVAGLVSEVGFKAVSEDGKGIDLRGTIHDSKMQEVALFSASHKGMGSFTLTPEKDETYFARVIFPDGTRKEYPLPLVKTSGTVIKVTNRLNTEIVEILIQASPDLVGDMSLYSLVVQTNEALNYAASVLLKQPLTRVRMEKNLFASGVSRITLLNSSNIPQNERMVFIDRKDKLDIKISSDKDRYSARDRISLEIQVKDKLGNPVVGSFALSITDDNHVKIDSLNSPNILSNMLITSGLKGAVEDPGYYVNSDNFLKTSLDLDKLLLTQGWLSYNWPEVFAPKKPMIYPAESEFTIKGRVTNLFNKGVSNSPLVLFSEKPLLLIDTLTDANGRFNFRNLPQADTAVYVLQSRNKKGASFNVGIEVDEFIPPVFSPVKGSYTPWYINSDTIFLKATKSIVKEQHRYDAPAGVNVLDEVVVEAKKIVKNSKNLNGAGNADYILDEEYLVEARKQTLFEVLEKRFGVIRTIIERAEIPTERDTLRYIMLGREINLVIDGVFIRSLRLTEEMYLNFLTAEELTGVELIISVKYGLAYDPDFIRKQTRRKQEGNPPIFVEVTTRSGNGAFLKKTPGLYLYKPLAFSFPSNIYRPKYPIKEVKPLLADLRSTIHWEPNIITDAEGKAKVSFYSADRAGNYTFILEGTDMNGGIGFRSGKLKITSLAHPLSPPTSP